ncbi:uncharacterized protein BDZ99DRAFT_513429 [Mytilinidion resinicola]|uniref:Uncharacterized protein n=1 Tax=Mytilinidion resinicola TaxID=574789 RepID=A0A6A6ZAE6_9PEZI|nr:uncharacterized protein BDZ99DRAFT_513429 [Mytilinidion resinicola]KAF2817177.1 hypothetical protein BDZ99DRAFT_513429 [Mytilinidion resinicola]
MPSTKRNFDAFTNNKQQQDSNPKRFKSCPEPYSTVRTSFESNTGTVKTGSTTLSRKPSANTSISSTSTRSIEEASKLSPEVQSSPTLSDVKRNRKTKTDWVLTSSSRSRAVWKDLMPTEKDVQKIRNIVRPYLYLAGISTQNFDVKILSEGSWNRAFTVSSKDAGGTHMRLFFESRSQ